MAFFLCNDDACRVIMASHMVTYTRTHINNVVTQHQPHEPAERRPTFLEVRLHQCRLRNHRSHVGKQPVPKNCSDPRSRLMRAASSEAGIGRPRVSVCRPTMNPHTSGLKGSDRPRFAGTGKFRVGAGATPTASSHPAIHTRTRRHLLLVRGRRRGTQGDRCSGAHYSVVAQGLVERVKKRVFGGRQVDSERGRSKGWSLRRHHLPLSDGWRWLMWLWVFDKCFRERSIGWRDKQKGGRRHGQRRDNAFALRAILFLLLSPVQVCQAVSCTTKIRDLVTSQPGITRIDSKVCNEGEFVNDGFVTDL